MQEIKKIYISWNDISEHTIKLCNLINIDNIKGMVIVARGGLIPGAIVASQLNIRKIETLSIKSYGDNNMQLDNYQSLSSPKEAVEDLGKGWIVIDDLVDTGQTIAYIKEILPFAKIYTVYSKIPNTELVNGYYKFFDKDNWICFPWESI